MLRLDDDTPFTDYSGFGVTATRASTEVKGPALTRSAGYSQAFNSVRIGAVTVVDFMTTGTERQSFSVTFTCRSTTIAPGSTDYTIFKRDDDSWHFKFTQSTVEFQYKFSDASTVTLSADYQCERKLDVAMVFNGQQAQLWLNGELVDDAGLLDADRTKVFSSTSDVFNITSTGTAYNLFMNNLTFYKQTLTGKEITDIMNFNETIMANNVAQAFAGAVVPVSIDQRKPYMEMSWSKESEWNQGEYRITSVDQDRLEAQKDITSLTLDSSWITAITFTLPVGTVPAFTSGYLWWEGKNEVIETSPDGTTWTARQKGDNLYPTSTAVDGTVLHIRLSFDAGLDEAYVDRLLFRAFTDTTSQQTVDSRIITYTGDVVEFDNQIPNRLRDDWGVRIGSSSSVTVGLLTGGETNKTLGVWVKPVGTSLTVTGWSGSTSYVNGVAGSTLIANQWNLVHLTNASGISVATVFGASQQIGEVTLYPAVLTAGDVANVHRAYTGIPIISVVPGDVIAVTESAAPSKIYSFNKLSIET